MRSSATRWAAAWPSTSPCESPSACARSRWWAQAPSWDRLGDLDVPLVAVAGELDERYLSRARRLALLAPRAEPRVVFGAGHAAHLEQPDAFAELLLEFLDQHLG